MDKFYNSEPTAEMMLYDRVKELERRVECNSNSIGCVDSAYDQATDKLADADTRLGYRLDSLYESMALILDRLDNLENFISTLYGNPNVHESAQPTRPFIKDFTNPNVTPDTHIEFGNKSKTEKSEDYRAGHEAAINSVLNYLNEEISRYEEHSLSGAIPAKWKAARLAGKEALITFNQLLIGLFKTEVTFKYKP